MPETITLQSLLKSKDKFSTIQRKVIVEELFNSEKHLTADEIFQRVKKKIQNISLGTVYRNLQVLEELNVIDRVTFKTFSEALYEVHKEPHYHIVCTECHSVKNLGSFRSVSLEPTAEKMTGFQTIGHDVTVYGICPVCKEKGNMKNEFQEV